MRYIFWIVVIILVCFFGAINGLINSVADGYGSEKRQYTEMVGEKVIIDNDTITVIDYSMVKETVTLSNGNEINFHLAKSNLCPKVK